MIRVGAILLFLATAALVRAEEESTPVDPQFQALESAPSTPTTAPTATTAEAPASLPEASAETPAPEQSAADQAKAAEILGDENTPSEPPPATEISNYPPQRAVSPVSSLPPHVGVENPEGYRVIQKGNNIELVTPWGRKILFGDPGTRGAREYRLEIPLSELRPPVAEETPKKSEREPAGFNLQGIPWPMPGPQEVKPDKEKKPEAPPRVVVEYDNTDRLILEANRLFNRRKFYEASITVEEILTKRPDFARAWAMKGSLMFVQGQRDLAKTAWQKAMELDPDNSQVKQYLGRLK